MRDQPMSWPLCIFADILLCSYTTRHALLLLSSQQLAALSGALHQRIRQSSTTSPTGKLDEVPTDWTVLFRPDRDGGQRCCSLLQLVLRFIPPCSRSVHLLRESPPAPHRHAGQARDGETRTFCGGTRPESGAKGDASETGKGV
jgi:hypothetical protein